MRYNFYDQLARIKKNANYALPEDINKPVTDWLYKIGCKIGAERVIDAQKKVQYKTIDLTNKKVPDAKISIQVSAGMVGERKEWEKKEDGEWVVLEYSTVKNPNLDKHKPKETK